MGNNCATSWNEEEHTFKNGSVKIGSRYGSKKGSSSKGGSSTNSSRTTLSSFKPLNNNIKIMNFASEDVLKVRERQGPIRLEKVRSPILEMRDAGILKNGSRYEGQWNMESGERQGLGKQIWADGSLYEGFYKRDKAHGTGRLIHGNGDFYEGDWKYDKSHGKGIYNYSNGGRYEGDWNEGK